MIESNLIQRLKEGDSQLFYELYEQYRSEFIDWLMQRYGLSREDARDVYQEVYLAFWINIREGKLYKLDSSIKTYLYAIGKHQAINLVKKNGRSVTLPDMKLINRSYNPHQMNDDRNHNRQIVEENLNKLNEKDRRILEMYYLEERDMKSIALTLGYKNADVAKKKKYEVFKKLMLMIKDNLRTFVI